MTEKFIYCILCRYASLEYNAWNEWDGRNGRIRNDQASVKYVGNEDVYKYDERTAAS